MLKVAISGPESTGKTNLAKALADHYNTVWVPEYAREYLTLRNGNYKQSDLISILKGQLKSEDLVLAKKPKLVFMDTSPLDILIWSRVKYGKVDPQIETSFLNRSYDYYLLLAPDIPWVYDPLRESKNTRKAIFQDFINELNHHQYPCDVVYGQGDLRTANAIDFINKFRQLFKN